jgi:hypothetical protein
MRKFEPLKADHPLVGEKCASCGKTFVVGDVPTLVMLGPGDSEENRAKAREGSWYNATAAPCHWSCATWEEP